MRLVFVLAGVSLVFGAIRVSCGQSPWRAVYTIDGQGFVCREGVPYFRSEHKLRDDDKMTGPVPWKKGSQNSIYFETLIRPHRRHDDDQELGTRRYI